MLKKLIILAIVACFALPISAKPTVKPRKVQRVTINLTRRGYEPQSFRLRKGIQAYVTFIRRTNDDCGEVVVIPAYGVRRTLPLNQPTTVRFTPRQSGTFNFACGMDMLRGTIVVN